MKCLERNKRVFYYALFDKVVPVKEPFDPGDPTAVRYETGETRVLYKEPVKARANISAAKGEAQIEQFGSSLQYDRVIIMGDVDVPIDENTVLFIDTLPEIDPEKPWKQYAYDYEVARVARSLTSVSIAIRKVDVK